MVGSTGPRASSQLFRCARGSSRLSPGRVKRLCAQRIFEMDGFALEDASSGQGAGLLNSTTAIQILRPTSPRHSTNVPDLLSRPAKAPRTACLCHFSWVGLLTGEYCSESGFASYSASLSSRQAMSTHFPLLANLCTMLQTRLGFQAYHVFHSGRFPGTTQLLQVIFTHHRPLSQTMRVKLPDGDRKSIHGVRFGPPRLEGKAQPRLRCRLMALRYLWRT